MTRRATGPECRKREDATDMVNNPYITLRTVKTSDIRSAMGEGRCPNCGRTCKRQTNFRLQAHKCTPTGPVASPEDEMQSFDRALRNAGLKLRYPVGKPVTRLLRFPTDAEGAVTLSKARAEVAAKKAAAAAKSDTTTT